jgi:hypothetical protein
MPSFSKLDDRGGGKSLAVKPVKITQRVRPRDCFTSFPLLSRFLALLMALAVAPPVLLAKEGDQEHGKVKDLTGVWLQPIVDQAILVTFHQDGTFSADVAGESAFVPNGVPPLNTLTTPSHGVWQKTGATTFAATSFAIIYDDKGSFLSLIKARFSGVLNDADHLTLTLVSGGQFDFQGNMIGDPLKTETSQYVRQRLEFP